MIVLTCITISVFFVGKLRHKALSKIFKIILLIIGVDLNTCKGFPGGSDGKESTCNEGDLGSISGSGRSPGEGDDNPLKYSCLENSVDTGAWLATVHGITKSRIQLSDKHLLTQSVSRALLLSTTQALQKFLVPSIIQILLLLRSGHCFTFWLLAVLGY